MAIPKAARKAAEEAERLHKELYGKAEEPQSEVDAATETADEAVVEEPTTEEPATSPVEAAPATETPEPQAVETQKDDPNSESWQHKYKVLQGMYNADIPRLREEIKELKEENEKLKQKPAAKSTTDSETARLLNDEEIEEFGPDLVDLIKRAAKEEIQPELERLRSENAELKSQVGNVSENISASGRQTVLNQLDARVPNWKEQNTDPEFLTWLNQVDPYSGGLRSELLQKAYKANDADRVVAFFKGYLQEANATMPPSTQAQSVAAPQPTAEPAKIAVDTLIAPGSPGSVAGQPSGAAEANTRIWTQNEISRFYREVQKGAYKGREAEKERIERDIVQAISGNRISA